MDRETIFKNGKEMRVGYTTGTCAAAAASFAARRLLFYGKEQEPAEPVAVVRLPDGCKVELPVEEVSIEDGSVRCGVRKDAGDDPDVTDRMLILATVSYLDLSGERVPSGVRIDGGTGVGRVTEPGLDQPVGAAAINTVPRQMITEAVTSVMDDAGYEGGLFVLIEAPGGEEIAKKTFNPKLGIEGGISILGTGGRVLPMSEKALVDTIRAEVNMKVAAEIIDLVFVPGNYGEAYAVETLHVDKSRIVHIGNFVGEAMDIALECGVCSVILVGHFGKLAKVALGVMNTHSRASDGRLEALAACALRAGATVEEAREILAANTTEEAVKIFFEEEGEKKPWALDALEIFAKRIEDALSQRVYDRIPVGAVVYAMQSDVVARSPKVANIMLIHLLFA